MCGVLFYKNVKEVEKEEQMNYEYEMYRYPAVYRETLADSIESNYDQWLSEAIKYEEEYKMPKSIEEKVLEVEVSQSVQDAEIITTQDAVNFLLFDIMNATVVKFKDKEMDKMAVYIANQILKGKVSYDLAVSKYPQFKVDIDMILVLEGKEDLIK